LTEESTYVRGNKLKLSATEQSPQGRSPAEGKKEIQGRRKKAREKRKIGQKRSVLGKRVTNRVKTPKKGACSIYSGGWGEQPALQQD